MNPVALARPKAPSAIAGALVLSAILSPDASGFDLNDKVQIGGLAAGALQCLEGMNDGQDGACRGAGVFQPQVFFNPTAQDQLFAKLGLAWGNGLNGVSPFALSPWSADLEDQVRDINGSGRSYLLEAWYAHTFKLGDAGTLQVTGGILDPAFYVNENAYANNQYTQFMNEAFVNDRNAILPAYDWGGVLVWKVGGWTFTGIGMSVGQQSGPGYDWYAAEAEYHIDTRLGEGNYRLLVAGTGNAFAPPEGEALEPLKGWALSFDQALGPVVGVFLRVGSQAQDASVPYRTICTGGLNLKGSAWGREPDNIGIGIGHLDGGNTGLTGTDVTEVYYRFVVNDRLALTADAQYMRDRYSQSPAVEGWVLGARATIEF